jgi:hypothetical protein
MEAAMSASPKKKYPFTPGPWIAHTEILTPGGLHVAGRSPSVRKDSHIVAGVGRFLDERLNHAKCPEAEANARLIAMAPELYEVLDRIVNECPTPSEAAITKARKVLADAIAD